jgi:hypothetical protein
VTADPTPYIAAAWLLSGLTLGGILAEAWFAAKKEGRRGR